MRKFLTILSMTTMMGAATTGHAQKIDPDWTFTGGAGCVRGSDGWLRIQGVANAGSGTAPESTAYVYSPRMFASALVVGVPSISPRGKVSFIFTGAQSCSRLEGCPTTITLNYPNFPETNNDNNTVTVNCQCYPDLNNCQSRP